MNRLMFETQPPPIASAPNRADIACFVGFVGRRATPLPGALRRWLQEQGWSHSPNQRDDFTLESLLDLPVPIDRWELFDQLFAWNQRDYNGQGAIGSTYLGTAVRSFFAQGGRKCYVIRVGDPWQATLPRHERLRQIEKLIPGYPQVLQISAVDRQHWSGVAHLFGLPDVSFLCLPDLADAVQIDPIKPDTEPPRLPLSPEQFVECSEPLPPPPLDRAMRLLAAPRCDQTGYRDWAIALQRVAELMTQPRRSVPSLREVQLVATVPLPVPGIPAERDLLAFLTNQADGPLAYHPSDRLGGIASAFVQLVYPWIQTAGAANLPAQMEPSEGALVGLLANNALTRGSFRSAANLPLTTDVQSFHPVLTTEQIYHPHPDRAGATAAHHNLLERVSLIGLSPSGTRLLSDVTTSLTEAYRPANINRLVASILRAARRLGEELSFEVASETLWATVRSNLQQLLLGLYQAGALRGDTPEQAFDVRCDRTTMSDNDRDNGRIIATVQFDPAAPIERIAIVLALNEAGQVSLLPTTTSLAA